MINTSDLIGRIYRVLSADATLVNASHLESVQNIIPSPRKPAQQSNPILTISGTRSVNEAEVERWKLILNTYVDNYNDGTADLLKLGNITDRIFDVLNDASITITGGRIFSVYMDNDVGILFDDQHVEEHYQSLMFTLLATQIT